MTKKTTNCLICNSKIRPFLNFGKMPVANGFLRRKQFPKEYFFKLSVAFCKKCKMVQLVKTINRERMFHKNYAFYSSTSKFMAEHFLKIAELIKKRYLKHPDPFIVEIGCNDGILLCHFAQSGIRHLGIEPSKNVAGIAAKKGIKVTNEFFDRALAKKIIKKCGKADVVFAANALCHIPYLNSVITGIKNLLKESGVLVFEDPYLGDIIKKTSYDQIYDEHAFYFSLASVKKLFETHGMEVVNVQHQDTHGGSMRYYISHKGAYKPKKKVSRLLAHEIAGGLVKEQTYKILAKKIALSKKELMELLSGLKRRGKHIAGYGATSKSATVINYCGITPKVCDFISDITPTKIGKFSPGAHIPVYSHAEFLIREPEYTILFAWNHAGEIMKNEKGYTKAGGKWIIYVPQVKVIK